ncbi:hypothetical protein ACFO0O_04620 [Cobetia amphilecti]|uniref:Uncharacterized protein n=1 Tax=Cobetia amphilecti TaxID=1055104 RepID=A0ABT6UNR4_9GAMM|nr:MULTISPECIES: hypothetical protein [Cobetia]MBR9798327.1 hypothetical protein [Gammaproteobacteria bacterium]MDI5884344.1 hypothetical protein [Cobetia amphilecti]UBU49106.1 hypothetical protein LCW13_02180 [Cobetia amphilecti]
MKIRAIASQVVLQDRFDLSAIIRPAACDLPQGFPHELRKVFLLHGLPQIRLPQNLLNQNLLHAVPNEVCLMMCAERGGAKRSQESDGEGKEDRKRQVTQGKRSASPSTITTAEQVRTHGPDTDALAHGAQQ